MSDFSALEQSGPNVSYAPWLEDSISGEKDCFICIHLSDCYPDEIIAKAEIRPQDLMHLCCPLWENPEREETRQELPFEVKELP